MPYILISGFKGGGCDQNVVVVRILSGGGTNCTIVSPHPALRKLVVLPLITAFLVQKSNPTQDCI